MAQPRRRPRRKQPHKPAGVITVFLIPSLINAALVYYAVETRLPTLAAMTLIALAAILIPAVGLATLIQRQVSAVRRAVPAKKGASDAGTAEAMASPRILRTVLHAIHIIGSNTELDDVTRALAEAAESLTQCRVCSVYLYLRDADAFVLQEGGGGSRILRAESLSTADVASTTDESNRYGGSFYIPIPDEFRQAVPPGDWCAGDTLLVPLIPATGELMGCITLDRPADGHIPTPQELAPLEAIASLAASVLVRLRDHNVAIRLAATDGLTGLLNRRSLDEHLEYEVTTATLTKRPLALLMIDLDDFGAVNNSYGHQVGDNALRLVARVISRHLRTTDTAGRYGGDEFTILLPGLAADQAYTVAERLCAALTADSARAESEGLLPPIHTSIGVAVFPRDAHDAAGLKTRADEALYVAKGMGKNTVYMAA